MAQLYCTNKNKVRREIDALKNLQGTKDLNAPSGLKLDEIPVIRPLPIPQPAPN